MGLVLPITCGICQQKWTVPSVADLIQTQEGQARLGAALDALIAHVKEKHPPAYAAAILPADQMRRLVALMNFQTEDAGAIQLRDYMRYQLWLSLQKNRPGTDEELGKIVDQMGLTMRDKPKVLDIMKQFRDIWCEMGKFEPQPLMPPKTPANGNPTLVTK